MSVETDLHAYLVTLTLVSAASMKIGEFPTPDSAEMIVGYPGFPQEYMHNPGVAIEKPAVQVQVRRKEFADAQAKAYAIYYALDLVNFTTPGGVRYLRVYPTTNPFKLLEDSNRRVVFATNFYVERGAP